MLWGKAPLSGRRRVLRGEASGRAGILRTGVGSRLWLECLIRGGKVSQHASCAVFRLDHHGSEVVPSKIRQAVG